MACQDGLEEVETLEERPLDQSYAHVASSRGVVPTNYEEVEQLRRRNKNDSNVNAFVVYRTPKYDTWPDHQPPFHWR